MIEEDQFVTSKETSAKKEEEKYCKESR